MTSRKIAATLLVTLPLVAAATSAMADQTFITTNWIDTKLSMDECLGRAAAAIRGAGGWGKVLETPDARHALRGMYTLQIRCLPDKEMAIVVVAGPSKSTAKYTDELVNHF
jgi:hypothetical protein